MFNFEQDNITFSMLNILKQLEPEGSVQIWYSQLAAIMRADRITTGHRAFK